MEQIILKPLPDITKEDLLLHPEKVTDFFGDNLDVYKALINGGSTWNKISLVDPSELTGEDSEQRKQTIGRPPLSPKILEDKIDSIVAFFNSNPEYIERLNQYLNS